MTFVAMFGGKNDSPRAANEIASASLSVARVLQKVTERSCSHRFENRFVVVEGGERNYAMCFGELDDATSCLDAVEYGMRKSMSTTWAAPAASFTAS
jgi:hypothetical protein